jgi:hypothetical protein
MVLLEKDTKQNDIITTGVPSPGETRVIEKQAIVNTVIDKPVLDQVIEKRSVEVHHKDVVQEIHEQPIIEVEKVPETKHVQLETEVKTVVDSQVTYDAVEQTLSKEEKERLEAAKTGELNKPGVQIAATATMKTIHEGEEIREIIIQPVVERHQQTLITEIHEKKVIEIHEHPIIRKIIEKPIIREIIRHDNTNIVNEKTLSLS